MAYKQAIAYPRQTYGKVYKFAPKAKPAKKRRNKGLVFISALVWSLIFSAASILNYENFLAPVYTNRINNKALHFDINPMPTLDYINNLNFMGQNLLAEIPAKGKEKILKINSSGNIDELESELKEVLTQYPNLHAGIFIYDYQTAKTVKINEDEIFPTASIIKLPILLDLFNRSKNLEKEGFTPIDLNAKRTFTEAHRTEGSGNLQFSPANVEYSLDYLAKIMIRKSDNSATNMLIEENGGINEINASLRHWGFKNTKLGNWLPDLEGSNVTTPEEIATMLYNIDNQAFLPVKSAAKVKEIMSQVENRTLIRSQLPDSATLLHKTGDIGQMLGDAGIIISPSGKKFILVTMVKRPHNDYSARELIQKTAKLTYQKLGV